uniref:LPXTG cell wall anchor domain-containing protein n=1 Tax=Streptococcus sp. 2001 TaxID=2582689 RepID=UPI001562706B
KLSPAEKEAAKKEAQAEADKAIQAIDAASDQAGVDKAQADGIAAVAAVTPVAKDKAKEAALPNTGSRLDSTTAALGLLSIFGAVGLLFSKKKKDDEEA